ncbi:MAG TPA: hypothetical protein VMH39_02550 [Gemmatimonadaceae bacterium]|nr:hypothetical protein [Gemmatimonadaceae bacterium]
MGVSTDAKLVYGFEVGEEEGDEEHDRCAALMDDDYDTLTKVEKRLGAELVYHCSDECTEYILGLKETYVRAWRGHPKDVDVGTFAAMSRDKMDAKLVEIAAALGLKAKPGRWLLCSYWG